MFDKLRNDWQQLPRERFKTKYILFVIIGAFSLLLLGQLTAQLFSVNQLNKASGILIKKENVRDGYSAGGRFRSGKQLYSFVYTLNSGQAFYLDNKDYHWMIDNQLHNGDHITIYYPSRIYRLLALDFTSSVCQIEFNNLVLYNFSEQKSAAWPFTALMGIAIAGFSYMLHGWYKNNSKIQ